MLFARKRAITTLSIPRHHEGQEAKARDNSKSPEQTPVLLRNPDKTSLDFPANI